jgi:hypothetical protein
VAADDPPYTRDSVPFELSEDDGITAHGAPITHAVYFSDVVGYEESERIDKLTDLLDAHAQIGEALREDREVILLSAPGVALPDVREVVVQCWQDAAVGTTYRPVDPETGDVADAPEPRTPARPMPAPQRVPHRDEDAIAFLETLRPLVDRMTSDVEADRSLIERAVELMRQDSERTAASARATWPDVLWVNYVLLSLGARSQFERILDDEPDDLSPRDVLLRRAIEDTHDLLQLEGEIRKIPRT